MANRIATEYVKATMRMTDIQMDQFLQHTTAYQVQHRVKVMDSGGQEIVLEGDSGEEVHLPFKLKDGMYVCELSCRLVTPSLTNAVRSLFAAHQGTGRVNRIYRGFMMSYDYQDGTVQRITQCTEESRSVVYAAKNTAGDLERLFLNDMAEREIEGVRCKINELLDQRLASAGSPEIEGIDKELRDCHKRLFVLEA